MNQPTDKSKVQGEGDYEAARRYDKAAREFAQSGKVDEAARQSRPESAEEAQQMKDAERTGQSHAKGEDPALRPGGDAGSGSTPSER